MIAPLPVAFLFDGVGGGELLLVSAAVLLLFGPRRLPDIARSIGRVLNDLRRASREFQDEIMRMDETPPRSSLPTDPPGVDPRLHPAETSFSPNVLPKEPGQHVESEHGPAG